MCSAASRGGSQAWLDPGAAAEPSQLGREGFARGSWGCRGFAVPLGSVAGLAAKGKADGNGRRCRKRWVEVGMLRRLRCRAGCDAPASFAAPSVALPHGPGGTEPGTLALGGDSPPCQVARRHGSPASASASSLPRLALLTELNLQFHGLVTMSLVYKIHELLGGVERRGDE